MSPATPPLPVADLGAALPHLRAPFPPGLVHWKVQRALADGRLGQVVGYLEVRAVYDRLNQVLGPRWSTDFERVETIAPTEPDGPTVYRVRCRLTLDGVGREDVGEGEDLKAAYSDAAKRAAVHFGVGVSIYALPDIVLRVGPAAGQLRTSRRGRPIVDERTRTALTASYARWLTGPGAMFGPALAADSSLGQGDGPDHDPPAPAPAAVPADPPAEVTGRAAPYAPATLRLVSELLHGRPPGELDDTERRALASVARAAESGGVGDAHLARATRRALAAAPRSRGAEALCRWLLEREERAAAAATRPPAAPDAPAPARAA